MKEILVAVAGYNRDANLALVEILSKQDEALLREDQGSFYKSILATLEHLAGAELSWLRRYGSFFSYPVLARSPLLSSEPEAVSARIKGGPASLYKVLAELDALFVAFAETLDEASLGTRVKFKNIKGVELERVYWNTIFHVLNHGTHHRGEISALLDRRGIENDIAGFNKYMK